MIFDAIAIVGFLISVFLLVKWIKSNREINKNSDILRNSKREL